jgi:hypothetical protein
MGINCLIHNLNKLNIGIDNGYDADDEMNILKSFKKPKFIRKVKKFKKFKNIKLHKIMNHMSIVSPNPV